MSVASDQGLPINWSPIGKPNLSNPTCEMPNTQFLYKLINKSFIFLEKLFLVYVLIILVREDI